MVECGDEVWIKGKVLKVAVEGIEEVNVLKFKKGDILILRSGDVLSKVQMERIRAEALEYLPDGLEVVIIDGGFGLEVLRREEDYKLSKAICPLCKGKKKLDKTKYGLMALGDTEFFCKCHLCKGKGYVGSSKEVEDLKDEIKRLKVHLEDAGYIFVEGVPVAPGHGIEKKESEEGECTLFPDCLLRKNVMKHLKEVRDDL